MSEEGRVKNSLVSSLTIILPARFFAERYLAGDFYLFNCKIEQGMEYFAKFAV